MTSSVIRKVSDLPTLFPSLLAGAAQQQRLNAAG
jgi:hypothetical protein